MKFITVTKSHDQNHYLKIDPTNFNVFYAWEDRVWAVLISPTYKTFGQIFKMDMRDLIFNQCLITQPRCSPDGTKLNGILMAPKSNRKHLPCKGAFKII